MKVISWLSKINPASQEHAYKPGRIQNYGQAKVVGAGVGRVDCSILQLAC